MTSEPLTGSYRKFFDTRFLAADDLPDGKEFALTITGATRETVHGSDAPVVALHFEQTPKMLALNKTNAALVRRALGSSDVAKWVGQKITIYPTTCNAFGDPNCPCIRVRAPKKYGK